MEEQLLKQVIEAADAPSREGLARSRRRVQAWFAQTARPIRWAMVESPLGALYVAASDKGLCRLSFGLDAAGFLNELDPLAHAEHNPAALAPAAEQLHEYFAGARFRFELPLDLDRLTPFQQSVLQIARTIAAGTVWTYAQVAQTLGKPRASRAVGQALGHNPVPIVIPCHRVIASDGSLGGYSARAGLEAKRQLLRLEGVKDLAALAK